MAYLYKQKYIEKQELMALKFLFRRVCSSISNAFRILHMQPFSDATAERISSIFESLKENTCKLVGPFISDEAVQKLSEHLNYVGSESFLKFCFENREKFKPVVYTITFYLNMH